MTTNSKQNQQSDYLDAIWHTFRALIIGNKQQPTIDLFWFCFCYRRRIVYATIALFVETIDDRNTCIRFLQEIFVENASHVVSSAMIHLDSTKLERIWDGDCCIRLGIECKQRRVNPSDSKNPKPDTNLNIVAREADRDGSFFVDTTDCMGWLDWTLGESKTTKQSTFFSRLNGATSTHKLLSRNGCWGCKIQLTATDAHAAVFFIITCNWFDWRVSMLVIANQ